MTAQKLSGIPFVLPDGMSLSRKVDYYLARIQEYAFLNAYLEVFSEEARREARRIEPLIQLGTAGKLAGMVIAIKDNICYKGHRVSAASRILDGYVSPFHSTAVERLLAEDAIILGRLNCDEFAMGGSNENSAFGAVLNPWDTFRVPGGSSGGSAVAVAAGLCDASLGSDTGGSIRQPAAFCGVVGLKPSYGRVSRHGLIAYASSFDQIGPVTRTVDDAARILQVIAGADAFDSTASDRKVPDYLSSINPIPKIRFALLPETLRHPSLDPEIRDRFEKFCEWLVSQGHQKVRKDFPYLEYLVPAYYTLAIAEASSNLARYDGVHYGYRSPKSSDMETTYRLSRTEGFGKEVKRRIMAGSFVLSSGYYDAYYTKAQKVRRLIRDFTLSLFEEADVLIIPATQGTAFRIGEMMKDPVEMYLQDIYTVHANLTGIPAISVPLGIHSNGLPIGVQACTRSFGEETLLSFARMASNFME